jgi:Sec-independent protein translocase protein TatA
MPSFLTNIGPTEIIILVIILIVFFGGKAITGLARTSGQTVKEMKGIKKEFTRALEDDDTKASKT